MSGEEANLAEVFGSVLTAIVKGQDPVSEEGFAKLRPRHQKDNQELSTSVRGKEPLMRK